MRGAPPPIEIGEGHCLAVRTDNIAAPVNCVRGVCGIGEDHIALEVEGARRNTTAVEVHCYAVAGGALYVYIRSVVTFDRVDARFLSIAGKHTRRILQFD